jgi:L-fuconate dehydratase
MSSPVIERISTRDARFQLASGEGSDAIHRDPEYSYAVTLLETDVGLTGSGLAFTLGAGNEWVCRAAEQLAASLVGQEIEEVMAEFGRWQHRMANDHQLRWLGPHKGVVHLALASVTNACFDLWAKSRSVPLWRLLLDLLPEQLVATLDLSYLEDVLTPDQALALLHEEWLNRNARQPILTSGYPGYDTSVGWFNYSDEAIRANCEQAVAAGFTALKLKVGSADPERDLRRARIVREAAGAQVRLMLDANQQWTLPQALKICPRFSELEPYWIEEPTHPDDVLGHRTLARAVAPMKIALGEHVPNRVLFKNYLQTQAVGFIQVDAVRVAGISEFLAVSLLCRKFGVPVVPHVGDMGQIHQHLVLFNHIGLGHEPLFLEYIPHLRDKFLHPAQVRDGRYVTPHAPGSSSDLVAAEGTG